MTGCIEIIRGCMFSGKTTELIRRLSVARGLVVAIKPSRDTRSGAARLMTHTGGTYPAADARGAADVPELSELADVVGIDEVQFFGAGLVQVCRRLKECGNRVIIAGVSLDHFGDPFEPFASLEGDADEIVELSCPCAVCGGRAIHSQRLGESTERIVVGGAEFYEPRCAACFVPSRRS